MVRRPDLERRMFIRDFGRGVLGISIGGVLIAACGDGEVLATTAATTTTSAPTTQASTTSTTAPTTTTTVESTTTTSVPATTTAPRSVLSVERVALGGTTAYLMVRGTEVAIVDTGTGGRTGDIGAALATVGLGWNDVGTVIITHKHGDHVGSLNGVLREATDAIVGTGQADIAGINSERPLEAFEDGQVVFGSTIIATPGHTVGHISVWDEANTGSDRRRCSQRRRQRSGRRGWCLWSQRSIHAGHDDCHRIRPQDRRPGTRHDLLRPRHPQTRRRCRRSYSSVGRAVREPRSREASKPRSSLGSGASPAASSIPGHEQEALWAPASLLWPRSRLAHDP